MLTRSAWSLSKLVLGSALDHFAEAVSFMHLCVNVFALPYTRYSYLQINTFKFLFI
ncbi:hypothetical protein M758_9G151900 [Ceratodon purpureus]|uniref:Uncharacterized protein n=1 Tax=Ceratodon purpureus TaxID=3225 RepID=A0A8T0GVJ7_CERPU|nr:hypothetical protein KC19_9G140300 [Ceratodon purpureus]KAG0606579.1 hypothetical protein M758_9G151900 [Ceratodon purpureus]